MDEISDTPPGESNPWINIWFRPRNTIRHIVNTDPNKEVLLLAGLSGINRFLDFALANSYGDFMPLPVMIVTALSFGALLGVILLYLYGALLRWSGHLLGGIATTREVRAAYAWSCVPTLLSLLLYLPVIVLFGHDYFTSSVDWMTGRELTVIMVNLSIGFISLALVIWQFIILIIGLAEVHRFSNWRGLATIIVGFLVLVVFLGIVFFGGGILIGG